MDENIRCRDHEEIQRKPFKEESQFFLFSLKKKKGRGQGDEEASFLYIAVNFTLK